MIVESFLIDLMVVENETILVPELAPLLDP